LNDAHGEQKLIYYLVAESPAAARSSPLLEVLVDRGIEVLLLTDRLDAWAIQHLTEFGGKELRDISRGELELPAPSVAETPRTEPSKDDKQLLKQIKRVLRDRVEDVRSGARLKESAACLVLGEHDIGHRMRDLLRTAGHDVPQSRPNLEVNLAHPLLVRLANESDEAKFSRLAMLMFDQAVLAEGRPLEDPAAFVRRLNDILVELGTGDVD
jgi:molecular chaperone HtpG